MKKSLAGNQATGTLKIIALVFMFIDHSGKMIFGNCMEMRLLGRIAFPIYCWCLVVGFNYTKNVWKYLLRIVMAGLISQPLYMIALNHTFSEPNVFLTLALALCGLWGISKNKFGSRFLIPVATLLVAQFLQADYGWKGVMLVYLMYMACDSKSGLAAVMIAFCLFWGTTSQSITTLFGMKIPEFTSEIRNLLAPLLKIQSMALLSLPFIIIPMKNVKIPSWAGYMMYPAHLAVLIIIEAAMKII